MEEWNEYGELKEQVDANAPAPRTPTASTNNTPSKPPPATSSLAATSASVSSKNPAISFAENIPPKQNQSKEATPKSPVSGVGSSFSLAMRQAGKEAAEKAKSKPTAGAARSSVTPATDLSKLDNSTPSGVPPPSGITDAVTAAAPNTGSADVISKADVVPVTEEKAIEAGKENPTTDTKPSLNETSKPKEATTEDVIGSSLKDSKFNSASETDDPSAVEVAATPVASTPIQHRGSSISAANKDEIKMVEEASKIEEEPEEEDEETHNVEVTEDTTEGKTPKPSQEEQRKADDKNEGPHVQFTNEAPEEEIDRVKPTLSRDASPNSGYPAPSAKPESIAIENTEELQESHAVSKTQEQGAADPQKAGESVGD